MITDLLPGKSHEDIIRDLSKLSKYKLNKKLLDAAFYGITSIIQYLIDAGTNVNTKDSFNDTPLMFASRYGYKDIVKILIDNGANVNIINNCGWTPLTIDNNKDIVKLLKKHGTK